VFAKEKVWSESKIGDAWDIDCAGRELSSSPRTSDEGFVKENVFTNEITSQNVLILLHYAA
jgi:hypothetical protein